MLQLGVAGQLHGREVSHPALAARRDLQLPVSDAPEHAGRALVQRPHAVPGIPLGPGAVRLAGEPAATRDLGLLL